VRDELINGIVSSSWENRLEDPNWKNRRRAVDALIAATPRNSPFPLPRTIQFLIKAAGDEDPHVAKSAYLGLFSMGEYQKDIEKAARKLLRRYPAGAQKVLKVARSQRGRYIVE
jgi:HEAT repeat protein